VEELRRRLKQCVENKKNYMSFVVRSCHQQSFIDELRSLFGDHDIYVIADWKMKFLPRRFR
jgi:hypothetical protein